MGKLIGDLRPVYAIGVGWRRYQYLSETSYVELGLRGEAGPRQQKGARTGLAHMVGVGAVCYVHILQK